MTLTVVRLSQLFESAREPHPTCIATQQQRARGSKPTSLMQKYVTTAA